MILGPVPRDGNRLEGGLNAALKRMLVNHRGLPEAHAPRLRMALPTNSAKPDPARILKQHDQDTKNPIVNDDDNEPTSQPTLGTGIDWNEFHTTPATPTPPTRSLNQHKMTLYAIWAYRSKCVDYVAGLPLWQ